ncbi:hypothetical protein D0T49_09000 [Paludibacter sp. 221]|nr:hypothetical protein [Paludibacter sp. 221]
MFVFAALSAQTFVSTTPAKKNAVIEEFTGVNCGNCPSGHKVVNNITAANKGRVVPINIHVGSYAVDNPNYKTPYGSAIADQSNLGGYPNGTVNRHIFAGKTKTAMSVGDFSSSVSTILAENSYVNVAAKSTLNSTTRELTVTVEVY